LEKQIIKISLLQTSVCAFKLRNHRCCTLDDKLFVRAHAEQYTDSSNLKRSTVQSFQRVNQIQQGS